MAEWNQCWFCGAFGNLKPRRGKEPTLTGDHFVPRSEGGTKLVLACKPCNGKKGQSSVEEYRAWLTPDGAESVKFFGEARGWKPW